MNRNNLGGKLSARKILAKQVGIASSKEYDDVMEENDWCDECDMPTDGCPCRPEGPTQEDEDEETWSPYSCDGCGETVVDGAGVYVRGSGVNEERVCEPCAFQRGMERD